MSPHQIDHKVKLLMGNRFFLRAKITYENTGAAAQYWILLRVPRMSALKMLRCRRTVLPFHPQQSPFVSVA